MRSPTRRAKHGVAPRHAMSKGGQEGLSEVVGNFANPVVIRSTCSHSEPVTFRKMLKRTWVKVRGASRIFPSIPHFTTFMICV